MSPESLCVQKHGARLEAAALLVTWECMFRSCFSLAANE